MIYDDPYIVFLNKIITKLWQDTEIFLLILFVETGFEIGIEQLLSVSSFSHILTIKYIIV